MRLILPDVVLCTGGLGAAGAELRGRRAGSGEVASVPRA